MIMEKRRRKTRNTKNINLPSAEQVRRKHQRREKGGHGKRKKKRPSEEIRRRKIYLVK